MNEEYLKRLVDLFGRKRQFFKGKSIGSSGNGYSRVRLNDGRIITVVSLNLTSSNNCNVVWDIDKNVYYAWTEEEVREKKRDVLTFRKTRFVPVSILYPFKVGRSYTNNGIYKSGDVNPSVFINIENALPLFIWNNGLLPENYSLLLTSNYFDYFLYRGNQLVEFTINPFYPNTNVFLNIYRGGEYITDDNMRAGVKLAHNLYAVNDGSLKKTIRDYIPTTTNTITSGLIVSDWVGSHIFDIDGLFITPTNNTPGSLGEFTSSLNAWSVARGFSIPKTGVIFLPNSFLQDLSNLDSFGNLRSYGSTDVTKTFNWNRSGSNTIGNYSSSLSGTISRSSNVTGNFDDGINATGESSLQVSCNNNFEGIIPFHVLDQRFTGRVIISDSYTIDNTSSGSYESDLAQDPPLDAFSNPRMHTLPLSISEEFIGSGSRTRTESYTFDLPVHDNFTLPISDNVDYTETYNATIDNPQINNFGFVNNLFVKYNIIMRRNSNLSISKNREYTYHNVILKGSSNVIYKTITNSFSSTNTSNLTCDIFKNLPYDLVGQVTKVIIAPVFLEYFYLLSSGLINSVNGATGFRNNTNGYYSFTDNYNFDYNRRFYNFDDYEFIRSVRRTVGTLYSEGFIPTNIEDAYPDFYFFRANNTIKKITLSDSYYFYNDVDVDLTNISIGDEITIPVKFYILGKSTTEICNRDLAKNFSVNFNIPISGISYFPNDFNFNNYTNDPRGHNNIPTITVDSRFDNNASDSFFQKITQPYNPNDYTNPCNLVDVYVVKDGNMTKLEGVITEIEYTDVDRMFINGSTKSYTERVINNIKVNVTNIINNEYNYLFSWTDSYTSVVSKNNYINLLRVNIDPVNLSKYQFTKGFFNLPTTSNNTLNLINNKILSSQSIKDESYYRSDIDNHRLEIYSIDPHENSNEFLKLSRTGSRTYPLLGNNTSTSDQEINGSVYRTSGYLEDL